MALIVRRSLQAWKAASRALPPRAPRGHRDAARRMARAESPRPRAARSRPPGRRRRKVGYEGGILTWKTSGRYASGSTCVRLACTSRTASQVGRNADRRRRLRIRQRARPRRREELGPVLGAEPPERPGVGNVALHLARHSSPSNAATSLSRCRSERRQVALDEARAARRPPCTASLGTDDVVGEAAEVGAPPLPGSRRRNAQDRHVGSIEQRTAGCSSREQRDQLPARFSGPSASSSRTRIGDRADVDSRSRRSLGRPSRPTRAGAGDGAEDRAVVAPRHRVDRAAHQRALDDRGVLVGAGSGRRDRRPQGTTRGGCTRAGAYWFWMPPIRESASGCPAGSASSSSCRASSARFSARSVRSGGLPLVAQDRHDVAVGVAATLVAIVSERRLQNEAGLLVRRAARAGSRCRRSARSARAAARRTRSRRWP